LLHSWLGPACSPDRATTQATFFMQGMLGDPP
jgi:hypothetical protein